MMMTKKFTGVKFTPQEFRLLTPCLQCGKAELMDGEVCDLCREMNLPSCDMCEILMRNGRHVFYTYDIKEDHRSNEERFKASKEQVREFRYEQDYNNPLNTELLCSECIGWQKRMKNVCRNCESPFKNTREHYKENGNYCEKCSVIAIKSEDESEETGYGELAREGVCHRSHSNQGV